MPSINFSYIIEKLSYILTYRDKKFFLLLVMFSIFISIIEVVGISAIMPFISISMDFSVIHSNQYLEYFYNLLNFKQDISFVVAFGVALVIFYIARSAINIFYTYLLSKFSQGRYHLIAYKLFENYMGMPYKSFVRKNSATLTKAIITEANNLTGLMSAMLFMMSEFFVATFIYAMLLFVDYKITLLLTVFLIINAIIMLKTISNRMKKHGRNRESIQQAFYEIINKSFGNFKLIKLQANDGVVLNEFANASHNYARTNIVAQTLLQVPRLLLEAIAFSLIIFIVLFLVWKYESNISAVLAILSMFVLALYRLMPSVNRIVTSYNQILFAYKSLDIIHEELNYDCEHFGQDKLCFDNKIKIKNIYFEYEEGKPVLENINLTLHKGSKIAIVGKSGHGKSTLIDIIIGLYRPTRGSVVIDNITLDDSNIKEWRKKIGYIPQSVYLFDGTVGDNIAFGSDYDENKIIKVLKQAQMYSFLEKQDGLNTIVGEGGIMLSGGQKQRIAIARALYTDPDILVLDEATSSLDTDTEAQIMSEIYEVSKNKTLIVVAHRLSTIQECDTIYTLDDNHKLNI